MRSPFAMLLAAAVVFSFSSVADAQLRRPRCQGWPARTGNHSRIGLLLSDPGVMCFGAVMDSIRNDCTLLASRVVLPPQQGDFTLIGLMEFQYTARPNMTGPDRIEIGMDWECRGVRSSNRARLNAMTLSDYAVAGGTRSSPPEGFGYNAR